MEEIDLKELIHMFWEKKVQIILITAIFAVVGLIYSVGFITPEYAAKTSLILATNSSSTGNAGSITTTDVTLNSKLISTYTRLVKSDRVVRNVISNLALNMSDEELKKSVSVTVTDDTEFMEITVKNKDPETATKIANEISKVLIENVQEFYKAENVHIVDPAEVPEEPCNINHTKDIIIFAFVGLIVAIGYVFILNMIDTTIKTEEDIEKVTGLRVLATLPLYESTGRRSSKKKSQRGGRR